MVRSLLSCFGLGVSETSNLSLISSNNLNPLSAACIKAELTIIPAPRPKKDRKPKNPSTASSGFSTEVNAEITAKANINEPKI